MRNSGAENIDIRFGEVENLPIADNSVDVIASATIPKDVKKDLVLHAGCIAESFNSGGNGYDASKGGI